MKILWKRSGKSSLANFLVTYSTFDVINLNWILIFHNFQVNEQNFKDLFNFIFPRNRNNGNLLFFLLKIGKAYFKLLFVSCLFLVWFCIKMGITFYNLLLKVWSFYLEFHYKLHSISFLLKQFSKHSLKDLRFQSRSNFLENLVQSKSSVNCFSFFQPLFCFGRCGILRNFVQSYRRI